MFYSHTLLARKGPLGTVWCAAHVHQRLKKSQYTSINIPDTVDNIMFPEVPLALRTSSHLLVGVVRIYSKKVDYLYNDWNLLNTWVAKAFVSTQVNLPEDARQAPPESVTLPQALNLDEFDLEDDTLDMEFDNHTRSEEDITLTDQIPTGIDPYVAVTFDEDIISESIPMDVDQSTEPVRRHTGEIDVETAHETGPDNEPRDSNIAFDTGTYSPRNVTEEFTEVQDPRQSNLTEERIPNSERNDATSPGTVPEIERMRDAAHDLSPTSHPSFAAQQQDVRVERTESLDETLNEKEPTIPSIDEEMLNSGRHSAFELRSGSPGSAAGSEEERADFVHPSPQLVLQPSPPQPQRRARKRKNFDGVTVLTNKNISERLKDPSDTLRKRKKMPSSKLKFWRMNNQSRKDQNFNEPLFTGFSDDLRNVFEKDYVASKPHLAVSDETLPEPASVSPTREAEVEINPVSPIPDSTNPDSTVQLSPAQKTEDVLDSAGPRPAHAESVATEAQSPRTFDNDDMGIEHLRDGGFPVYMPSPPPRSSPFRTDDFTTQSGNWETESYRTEPSTSTVPEDLPGQRNLGLSPVSERTDEELYFLEVGGNSPVGTPASQDSAALTGRARALAQYLKQRSSSSPTTSSHPSGDLSLSEILAGKTRKLAARMFFETLVLKSRGLIDMQQDRPYGDIALKLMPALFSKVQT
ncbi:Sister chromatid cohesion 1 protein 3 [Arabidopsis thaliana]|uniref:SYN3 n=2 Tax=Arabidopsis TaxID=3701 RepID=A0A178VA03_ARATH|nr:cohesion family protein SYN3 [Arabidopsis thaliana]KAG7629091.1 Winged helix DNA-binding domain superfamily [Arabidopsis thaliana x Arabidopsis arenosa]OAP01742.1 SYN3 [Arabidopsis thaliana]